MRASSNSNLARIVALSVVLASILSSAVPIPSATSVWDGYIDGPFKREEVEPDTSVDGLGRAPERETEWTQPPFYPRNPPTYKPTYWHVTYLTPAPKPTHTPTPRYTPWTRTQTIVHTPTPTYWHGTYLTPAPTRRK